MTILITGGTHGMGKGVAKILSKSFGNDKSQHHEIILLARSETLGQNTIEELQRENPFIALSLVVCDLADMSTVQKAVTHIKDQYESLDGIFINAGIGYGSKRIETIDGMDSHFQVNYLAQMYLVLELMDLFEKSPTGARIIFNATTGGKVFWEDLQLSNHWTYEKAIQQAMVAKRMLVLTLEEMNNKKPTQVLFLGFSISKTVWTNQINIIPRSMRIVATVMKWFGLFISEEQCGQIMAPLFLEDLNTLNIQSGGLYTNRNNRIEKVLEDSEVLKKENRMALWDYSIELIERTLANRLSYWLS
jgi:NAD(P)-dependent dehydrogenase (short-subunit alcohol dehydrogenase family)